MNTTKIDFSVFNDIIGTPFDSFRTRLPAEWEQVDSDKYIHVFKTTDRKYLVIIACDNDGIIRYDDEKKLDRDGKYQSIYMYSGIFGSVHCYRDIKIHMDITRKLEQKYNTPLDPCTSLQFKTVCRKIYNQKSFDRLSAPIANSSKSWRTVADPEGDSCTDFIVIPDRWSDLWGTDDEEQIWEDIEDFIYTTVGYQSGYDFPTGQMITLSWSFKRIPAGVAVVHHRGIDW